MLDPNSSFSLFRGIITAVAADSSTIFVVVDSADEVFSVSFVSLAACNVDDVSSSLCVDIANFSLICVVASEDGVPVTLLLEASTVLDPNSPFWLFNGTITAVTANSSVLFEGVVS